MRLKEHFDLMGYIVQDRVTGITGVCVSICFDLYGCVQASVYPPLDPAKPHEIPEGHWYDTKRLRKVSLHPVMEVPTFETVPGPAAKPSFRTGPLS